LLVAALETSIDKEAATPAKGMLQEEQRPEKKQRLVKSNG
jgi:hypothetical protein